MAEPVELNEAQVAKLIEWWEEKGVPVECELCGEVGWEASVFGVEIPAVEQEEVVEGPAVPLVAAACNNCANVRFFVERVIELF